MRRKGLEHREALESELRALLSGGRIWTGPGSDAVLSNLTALLVSEPSVDEFAKELMRSDGAHFVRLEVVPLARWLVARARANGVESAIQDLDDYGASNTFRVRFSMAVSGISVTTAYELAGGVRLIPASPDATLVVPEHLEGKTAALTLELDHPKILIPPDVKVFEAPYVRSLQIEEEVFDRLDLARLCIALTLDHPVVIARRVATPLDAVPPSASPLVAKTSYVPRGRSVELNENQVASATAVHGRFIKLNSGLSERLMIAARRWHQAMLHFPVGVDTFIDVGIGLELVYVADGATELKYRLRIRGARLLGGTSQKSRISMSNLLGALYDARSTAVHTGRMITTKDAKKGAAGSAEHLAVIGRRVLRDSIVALIQRGREAWDELVLS